MPSEVVDRVFVIAEAQALRLKAQEAELARLQALVQTASDILVDALNHGLDEPWARAWLACAGAAPHG